MNLIPFLLSNIATRCLAPYFSESNIQNAEVTGLLVAVSFDSLVKANTMNITMLK